MERSSPLKAVAAIHYFWEYPAEISANGKLTAEVDRLISAKTQYRKEK